MGSDAKELLRVEDLHVHFPVTQGILFQRKINEIKAVDGVSFTINEGDTMGLVGESGCGKTTTGRAILKLIPSTSGRIVYDGVDITGFTKKEMIPMRLKMQMIFQDPYASLNPRQSVMDIISDPLVEHHLIDRSQKKDKVGELMQLVGLNPRFMNRFPHEFSGGQRQRIGIARSLAMNSRFIVCDEPIAALDVSIQAQVINLLQDLQDKMGLTYLFIAHDLSVVRHISDRVVVMYLGNLVEVGPKREIFNSPLHPYTKVLMSAVPKADPKTERLHKRLMLTGEIPSPLNKPKGCPFSTRCPIAQEVCHQVVPVLREMGNGHQVACHLVEGR
ncbi:MAG: ABC transporter ATP-binding protein [Sphaerochaetaceae bacterium]